MTLQMRLWQQTDPPRQAKSQPAAVPPPAAAAAAAAAALSVLRGWRALRGPGSFGGRRRRLRHRGRARGWPVGLHGMKRLMQ